MNTTISLTEAQARIVLFALDDLEQRVGDITEEHGDKALPFTLADVSALYNTVDVARVSRIAPTASGYKVGHRGESQPIAEYADALIPEAVAR